MQTVYGGKYYDTANYKVIFKYTVVGATHSFLRSDGNRMLLYSKGNDRWAGIRGVPFEAQVDCQSEHTTAGADELLSFFWTPEAAQEVLENCVKFYGKPVDQHLALGVPRG